MPERVLKEALESPQAVKERLSLMMDEMRIAMPDRLQERPGAREGGLHAHRRQQGVGERGPGGLKMDVVKEINARAKRLNVQIMDYLNGQNDSRLMRAVRHYPRGWKTSPADATQVVAEAVERPGTGRCPSPAPWRSSTTSLLVHDDVMDNDPVRRGRPLSTSSSTFPRPSSPVMPSSPAPSR